MLKTLNDFALKGKNILLRVDLNVPYKDGKISDSTRIKAIIPSINHICKKGGRVILLSHFGRPKGHYRDEMSLVKICPALEQLLGQKVVFLPDFHSVGFQKNALPNEKIFLLENLRFHPEEERNDEDFAQALSQLGDIYINDAFSVSHRAHASVVALARLLPAGIGWAMQREINTLKTALTSPKRPLSAIIGGAKISTKIGILENLMTVTDNLIIGGAMANNFLCAQKQPIGRSLIEPDYIQKACEILDIAKRKNCTIHLPVDAIIAKELTPNAQIKEIDTSQCPDDVMMLDIGSKTLDRFKNILVNSVTLVWNGPLGAFETPPFDNGTNALACFAAKRTTEGTLSTIAGGGDTLAALNIAGVYSDFSYVSTGGGAFLEWMEGKKLPAITALED